MKKRANLGIDFGGVIIPMVDRSSHKDTQFSDRFLATAPHAGAIQRIQALVDILDGRVWIISKAGWRTEGLTREWLRSWDFFRSTGLKESHVRFCRERPEKLDICSELCITHFVDDRIHVMQILRGTVPNLYLFGDKLQNRSARKWTRCVEDWTECYEAISNDLLSTG